MDANLLVKTEFESFVERKKKIILQDFTAPCKQRHTVVTLKRGGNKWDGVNGVRERFQAVVVHSSASHKQLEPSF